MPGGVVLMGVVLMTGCQLIQSNGWNFDNVLCKTDDELQKESTTEYGNGVSGAEVLQGS